MMHSLKLFILFMIFRRFASLDPEQNFTIGKAFIPMTVLMYLEDTEYDRSVHPNKDFNFSTLAAEPQITLVYVSLHIESIGNLKIKEMEFDVDMYLLETWYDHRLNPDHLPLEYNINHDTVQLSDWKLLDKLWRPDLYFSNSKETSYNDVTVPNMHLRIHRNGVVKWSVRIASTFACHMDLHSYPFDQQTCRIKMSTYANSVHDIRLIWEDRHEISPLELNEDIQPAEYKLIKHTPGTCETKIEGMNYPCLEAVFEFQRARVHYIMLVYLPFAAIVCISWISFWIDPSAIPGRVSLCITTLLTLSTQAAGLAYRLPQVGYAKAQDIWMLGCLTSLFATLIEFSFVSAMATKAEQCEQEYIKKMKSKAALRAEQLQPSKPEAPPLSFSAQPFKVVLRRIKTASQEAMDAVKLPESKPAVGCKTKLLVSPPTGCADGEVLLARAELFQRIARVGDVFARVAFPAAFFVFTGVYFYLFY